MKVNYSYLPRQFVDIDDLLKKIKDFVKTGDFTLGKPLVEFEKKFAKLMGVKYAIGVNSGTDAIKLSLKALGIKKVGMKSLLQLILLLQLLEQLMN